MRREPGLARGPPPATAKPLAQPLAIGPIRGGLDLAPLAMSNSRVGTRLDVCERPLLEAAALVSRADIAQSVEQRFRKP